MAYSKIVLTFTGWDSGSPITSTIVFQVDGASKNETVVSVRSGPGQVAWVAGQHLMAQSFVNAWTADYAGTSFTLNRVSNVVTITATYDGAVFDSFAFGAADGFSDVDAVITNEAFDYPLELTGSSLSEATSNKCTTIKVTLTETNGLAPFTWNTILPGNTTLIGDVPRVGGPVDIEIEDDDGEIDTITVQIPAILDNSAVAVVIAGDPSGLFGTVTINMAALFMLEYTYSLDDVTYQASNIFTSILPGTYTLYVKDQYGCKISYIFEVALSAIRPPAYSLMPKSNSFGWYQQQAAANNCSNPYNGNNARPNDYKPLRFYNPKYFQPWCTVDAPKTQFRSNYDTLTATLIRIIDDTEIGTYTITKKSDNIGQRQIMDATIYDRGAGQTGVYWTSGNTYEPGGVIVNGSYTLDGGLPEWARVGQTFSLSGSDADGIYEIKQIIYDSDLLVNVAVIDRVYTDIAEEVAVIVDAAYNRLNYEVYEFTADFSALDEGCYKILLEMVDSLEEYPDSTYETHPFIVSSSYEDLVLMQSSDHIDDGILYSTGIVHLQRFQGLFYDEDYPSTYETSRDSRKALNKLDGRVEKSFILEAIDIPMWVHEKLALFISKNLIYINNLKVQFEEKFEVEKFAGYSRRNLKGEAFVDGYEQYMTNTYDIL